jgi:hypothetical protein
LLLILLLAVPLVAAAAELRVGFAEKDITPEVGADKPAVWLAGYGFGRKATGVHDPLMARAVVLSDGRSKIALVSVDLVGLQYDAVREIRSRLEGFRHVTVASTHNHEGPDVIGIWGPTPFQRGVNQVYLQHVIEQVAAAIKEADANVLPVSASFGTAEDETLLDDTRKPEAKDGVLRVLKFTGERSRVAGLVVQWNSHPEAMSSKNTLITADFPAATVEWLKKKYDCPVVYVSGAVGGLMTPPDHRIKDDDGQIMGDGSFDYTWRLGEETGRLASRAIESAKPIELTPLDAATRQLALPVDNMVYRLARQAGVLKREGRLWTGDPEKLGEVADHKPGAEVAIVTEVGCLKLGELTIFNIPGELYPELIYGKFQEPADPAADFPEAPLEPTAASLAPSEKWMLFGLANDEVGYIIPKRQWDESQPYCYGRAKSQYGEVNSCGPQTAPILMKALADCAREVQAKR